MIGRISGSVDAVTASLAIIAVSGVGFEVRMPVSDLAELHVGEQAQVYTTLAVTQDSIILYGFLTQASKRVFAQLQKVSGIGPKVALAVLSAFTPDQLARAIRDHDVAALTRTQGLGKKGAQKIILELSGYLDTIGAPHSGEKETAAPDRGFSQVLTGLVSLGWPQQDARRAVTEVCRTQGISPPLAAEDESKLLKQALAALDRGR